MKWKCVFLATGLSIVSTTGIARAESVALAAGSPTTMSYEVNSRVIDIYLPQVAVVGPIFLRLDGLVAGGDYLFRTHLTNATGQTWHLFEAELLNKAGVGGDARDTPDQPAWAPSGYSASNDSDGFSFAQRRRLPRTSDSFLDVFADEFTDARDFLRYSGGTVLAGSSALLTFGIRENFGNRPFLLALGPNGVWAPTPEPSAVLLIGTGLVGLVRAARRRRRP